MKVTDPDGHGLMLSTGMSMEGSAGDEESQDGHMPCRDVREAGGLEGLDVNVSPWSPHELEEALHPTELPPVHYTYVRIGQQMGIGGDDSWGAPVHEEFLLHSNRPRRISFIMKGI